MRNKLIPATLAPEAVAAWLRNNAKESFDDESKHVFTDEELNDFARKSSSIGGTIIDLDVILKNVTEACKKGTPEDLIIEVPKNTGTDMLKKSRLEYDTNVKAGYELLKQRIYGIPDDETAEMVYFNEVGEEVADRRRPLSAKEQNEYIGLFLGMDKTKFKVSAVSNL